MTNCINVSLRTFGTDYARRSGLTLIAGYEELLAFDSLAIPKFKNEKEALIHINRLEIMRSNSLVSLKREARSFALINIIRDLRERYLLIDYNPIKTCIDYFIHVNAFAEFNDPYSNPIPLAHNGTFIYGILCKDNTLSTFYNILFSRDSTSSDITKCVLQVISLSHQLNLRLRDLQTIIVGTDKTEITLDLAVKNITRSLRAHLASNLLIDESPGSAGVRIGPISFSYCLETKHIGFLLPMLYINNATCVCVESWIIVPKESMDSLIAYLNTGFEVDLARFVKESFSTCIEVTVDGTIRVLKAIPFAMIVCRSKR